MHWNVTSTRCRILILAAALACTPAVKSDEPDAAILRALEKKVSVDFNETPLSQAIAKLAAEQGISAALDKKALDDSGVGLDTPVTFKIKDASLRNVLKLILKEFDLTWTVGEEMLLVTTVDEAGQRLTMKVHDVSDLLRSQMAGTDVVTIPPESFDTEPLVDLISTIVVPSTWDQVGGPGSIKAFNGMLVISQTDEAHEQIEKLLAELRKVQAKRNETSPKTRPAQDKDPQALQLRVYRITRKGPVVGVIGSPIPVVGGIEPPVDRIAPLAQFGGSGPVPPRTPAPEVMKQLEAIIPVFIEPQSWQSTGGQGVIRTLSIGGDDSIGTLLIRQTPAVHAQITQLLMQLNAGMRLSTPLGGGNFF